MRSRGLRIGAAVVLVAALVVGGVLAWRTINALNRFQVVAYFDNSNGLFVNDEVRVLGVAVGRIMRIEPQPQRAKITFWVDKSVSVPADARAAIVSPQLVTSRAIQLTPAYTGGDKMADGAVIEEDRTAVPLEWDDLRLQLEKLTEALQPTEPGGVSTLGAFVDTAADNLRGQGVNMHDTIVKLSQALSILGDHSTDMFSTVKNLSIIVSALHDSSSLLRQLNVNLASATGALASSPDAVGNAVKNLNDVVGVTTDFISENRDAIGVTTERLASITTAVHDSIDDVEQALHLFPNTLQNFINIYQPTQQGITGALTLQNFANPISFLCGGIQAASRLNGEQSAKLCAQYLAPIIKNRQYNFLPLGANYIVGESARPNELTYSEDWLRPDFRPTSPAAQAASPAPDPEAAPAPNAPAAPGAPTDPAAGLQGLMVPPSVGSGS
ncbi:mammalian cell entry protein [Mycolicibacterium novocastrense]|uniref:MCE family protein n=1 Tax=Mycolicibacterium novocastrense TaxID=59813 RepID=UPI000746466B|nr:MCE family protein [Mycolicibacterium novocastrense]KUH70850.1 mammalian cell entry protein [Mycolicibacterium novocastrense]KUH71191.1 mammalian cell entry protein [Mycolicibacterium novocastrense]KUH73293.1 mammalian cell entry protein [Mycolicibacterium novocastrense]